jgi:hypothetical protein
MPNAEKVLYHLWLEERERLLQRPALQGAYHVEILKRLGEAPSLSDVIACEKYDLSTPGDCFYDNEVDVDPHILDQLEPPERGIFYSNVTHPRYEPCYRGKPYEMTPEGGIPDPLDPHRRFNPMEEGTFVRGREWTI